MVANDPTVKAGSWGARTVEKIVRMTEYALRHETPIFWLIDSAGARITDQVDLFPGRRGAGRIFSNQVKLSGKVPQICCLFGPSAAGGAYIPAFCDVVIMVEGNASMYLGSPRMAEEVIGERVTLEEMGGARMHVSVSGCGDNLATDDTDAIEQAKHLFSYLPTSWRDTAPTFEPDPPARVLRRDVLPAEEAAGYDMHRVIEGLIDDDSFMELKPLFAPELTTGLARLDGHVIGVVANNPMHKGGVLFGDSADKAARFVWMCDAYNIPLLFLADVPGFMIGTQVERDGIIRHGAKMITAVTEATVPKICVIVRKAYGAGLYAMCGPAFDPIATLALPTAKIAVMGPEAAINAVFANKIAAIDDADERAAFIAERRRRVRSRRRSVPSGQRTGHRRSRLVRRPARRRGPPVRHRRPSRPPGRREETCGVHGVNDYSGNMAFSSSMYSARVPRPASALRASTFASSAMGVRGNHSPSSFGDHCVPYTCGCPLATSTRSVR